MIGRLVILIAMFCASVSEAAGQAAVDTIDAKGIAAASGWKTQRLDLDITIAPQEGYLTVEGRAVLELEQGESRALALLINSRRPVMVLDTIRVVAAGGLDPASVEIDPNLRFAEADSMRIMRLRLPKELSAGQSVEVAFAYHSSGQSKQVIIRPDVAYASWVEAWYPTPVDDNDPADPHSGRRARAPGRTMLRLPAEWWALSNGKHTRRTATETGAVDVWQDSYGTARSFVAAHYLAPEEVTIGDRTVAIYLLTPKPLAARAQAERLSQAVDVLSNCFGPYPFGTFAIAEAPMTITTFGAASEQGFIVALTYFLAVPDGNLALFAHEAGHTWWGNLVSSTGPGSQVCSESISQYGAVLAIEAIEGKKAALDFLEFSRLGYVPDQCARGYFGCVRAGDDRPLSALDGTGIADHMLSDSKGHWVFHMLREAVGDTIFFNTLRQVVVRYTNQQLTLDKLRQEFIAAAPDVDLETFFAQWLDRAGAPAIDVRWGSASSQKPGAANAGSTDATAGPVDVTLLLEQVQGGAPYALDLDVAIELDDGTTATRTLHMDTRKLETTVQLGARPTDVHLDPERKILMWRPAYGSKPSADVASGDDAGE